MQEPLTEGHLYKVVNGKLVEIVTDEDDQIMRKIRVPAEVLKVVQGVQKRMRKALNGRKPDLALVAEALLVHAAQQPGVEDAVRDYAVKVYSNQQQEVNG